VRVASMLDARMHHLALADTLTFESHTITKMFTQTLQHLAMFLGTMP